MSISWGIKKINAFFLPCSNWVYSDHSETLVLQAGTCTRGFNNFGDKRLFEVEQTAVIEKGP